MAEKKVKVIIEETITYEVEIPENKLNEIEDMYDRGKLFLKNGELQNVCYATVEDGELSSFVDICI